MKVRWIKLKITVLAGGTSTERDVSFVSGAQVYRALKEKGHEVILLDVFMGYSGEDALDSEALFKSDRDWAADIKAVTEAAPDIEEIRKLRPDKSDSYFGPNVIHICRDSDIVFMALHGGDGENGRVQAALRLFGIKYTGSGYMGSALAMDKYFTKLIFDSKGVPTPEWKAYKKGEKVSKSPFGYPAVVKTHAGGSSVGVYIVNSHEEFVNGMKNAFKYGTDVIVEKYIKGRELTCCVIDGKAYPIVEIIPKSGFYDYKNKYQAGSTTEICPAEISDELTKKVQDTAVMAYKSLGLESYARMDFIADAKDNVYCLEANTLPGMTPTSLVPQEAAAVGLSFADLCQLLIDVSLKKYED